MSAGRQRFNSRAKGKRHRMTCIAIGAKLADQLAFEFGMLERPDPHCGLTVKVNLVRQAVRPLSIVSTNLAQDVDHVRISMVVIILNDDDITWHRFPPPRSRIRPFTGGSSSRCNNDFLSGCLDGHCDRSLFR